MVTRNRTALRAETLVAGVVAWLALNAFAYLAAPLFGLSFGEVGRFFGSLLLPGVSAAGQLWTGRALFLLAALVWAFVYRWARPSLSGPAWLRGFVFGSAIWVVSGLLLPLLGAVHPLSGSFTAGAGGGTFPGLFGLGFDGGAGVVLSLLSHQVFGVTVGLLLRR